MKPIIYFFLQGQGNVKFSIWVSFAEIYNEFIYDLLDKIPTSSKRESAYKICGERTCPDSLRSARTSLTPPLHFLAEKKFKRRVLRLSDDPNGNVFIKGLKKICVNNADEAYRVMLAGE